MTSDYPPRIVFKCYGRLDETVAIKYDYHFCLKKEEVTLFESTFPNLKIERLFASVKPEDILKQAHEARDRHFDYEVPLSFLRYFTIVCREGASPKVVIQLL